MADAAVILGVTGILTSGVLGPAIVNHVQTQREGLADLRTALDDATEALATSAAQIAWLSEHAFGPKAAEWDEHQDAAVTQIYVLESHVLRLKLRFGSIPLTDAYGLASGALHKQSSILWENAAGHFALAADVRAKLAEAHSVYISGYDAFLEHGRRWYEDSSGWPYRAS